MSGQRVVVIGGANVDTLALVREQPQVGRSFTAAELQEGPGGKGANQAAAAAHLGGGVELVGRVGSDAAGEQLANALVAAGVGTRCLTRDDQQPTGRVVGVVQEGVGELTAADLGANSHLEVSDVLAAADALEHADVLLCQLEVPLPAVRCGVAVARRGRALVALDPAPPVAGVSELIPVVDAVMLNASEATALTEVEVTDEGSAVDAAGALLARGLRYAAVSAGAAGDLLAWHGGHAWAPAPDVQVVDPTGAGDVLHAALALRLAAGWPPAEALRFASASAALSMRRLGAQTALPDEAEVQRLLTRGHRAKGGAQRG